MRTAQPLMERLNDWQSHNNINKSSTRGQQVDNTAPLQLASHYTRTLIIRSIYRPFCTLNSRSSSQTATNGSGRSHSEPVTSAEKEKVPAGSKGARHVNYARITNGNALSTAALRREEGVRSSPPTIT